MRTNRGIAVHVLKSDHPAPASNLMEYLQVAFQSEIISRQFVSQLAFEGQLQQAMSY